MKAQAIASYEQSTATYKETVLQAFQEVEDTLAASQILEREAGLQTQVVTDAQHSLDLSIGLYKTGLTNYLQVITVQTTLLANQRVSVDLATRKQRRASRCSKHLSVAGM